MIFNQFFYNWTDKYRLLAEVDRAVKYQALTRKAYTAPVRPPASDSAVVNTSLRDKQARAKQELDGSKKADCAVVEGFCKSFGKKIRKAFKPKVL